MTVHGTEPGLVLELDGGGTARVVASDGDRVTLEGPRPYPPGSTLIGRGQDASGEYRVKVRGSRKRSDRGDVFTVEGRFVDLTREQRSALLARLRGDAARVTADAREKP